MIFSVFMSLSNFDLSKLLIIFPNEKFCIDRCGKQRVPASVSQPDAAKQNGPQQGQDQQAAHQAQLLPRHGKNEIRVPGGQGRRGGALGLGPLEVSLARDLARTNGQQAALLLE